MTEEEGVSIMSVCTRDTEDTVSEKRWLYGQWTLAKVMRRELKKRGIKKLKVVYSQELPVMPSQEALNSYSEEQSETAPKKRSVPGSVAFVPSVAGLIIAGEVLKDLINF